MLGRSNAAEWGTSVSPAGVLLLSPHLASPTCNHRLTVNVSPRTEWRGAAMKFFSFRHRLPRVCRAHGGCPVVALWFGESPQECLVREFMEEAGLVARVGDLLDVISDVGISVRESTRLHSVRVIYEVEAQPGSERSEADGSTDAVRWVRGGDLGGLPLIPWLGEFARTHLSAHSSAARLNLTTPCPPCRPGSRQNTASRCAAGP